MSILHAVVHTCTCGTSSPKVSKDRFFFLDLDNNVILSFPRNLGDLTFLANGVYVVFFDLLLLLDIIFVDLFFFLYDNPLPLSDGRSVKMIDNDGSRFNSQ